MDLVILFRTETFLVFTVINLVTAVGFIPYSCPKYCHCDRRTRDVSCMESMFTEVPSGFPHGMRTLWLQGQNFTYLKNESLVQMRSLRKLNLANDNIHFVAVDAFSNVPKLKRLDLSFNYLGRIPAPVSRITSLKELIVHNSRISFLKVDTFANLTQLQILDLANNGITNLPDGVFSKMWQLTILYLSNNSINALSDRMFGNLSRLEELHLTQNRIEVVSAGWLSSVPNTWVLELGFALNPGFPDAGANLLTTSGTDVLPNMEHLVVSGNDLPEIPCELFAKFRSLTYLDLGLNSIRAIPQACFRMLNRLDTLKLDNNAITLLEYRAFNGSRDMWVLDLSGNYIEELPPGVFTGSRIRSINLSFNVIRRLNNESFIGLDNLMELFLSSNLLERLSRPVLRPLVSIEILDLRWNYLTRVTNQFCNMSSLTNLALSSNTIKHIHPDAFRGSKNLRGLFLDNNRLTTIAEDTVDLPNLVDVKLYENPWHCDCRIRWMREAMSKPKKHPWMVYTNAQGVASYKGIVCVTPYAFENVSMFMIKETDIFRLTCTTYVSPLAIEFIVGISFAIIVSSMLCYVAKLYCRVREIERNGADHALE